MTQGQNLRRRMTENGAAGAPHPNPPRSTWAGWPEMLSRWMLTHVMDLVGPLMEMLLHQKKNATHVKGNKYISSIWKQHLIFFPFKKKIMFGSHIFNTMESQRRCWSQFCFKESNATYRWKVGKGNIRANDLRHLGQLTESRAGGSRKTPLSNSSRQRN